MTQLNLFLSPKSEQRRQNLKPNFMQITSIVDFEKFRPELQKSLAYKKNPDGRGRPPFDCVVMWKIVVLQAFYDCSDDQWNLCYGIVAALLNSLVCIHTQKFLMQRASGYLKIS
jgi:hypothetical protein